jgi:hypothetical protein
MSGEMRQDYRSQSRQSHQIHAAAAARAQALCKEAAPPHAAAPLQLKPQLQGRRRRRPAARAATLRPRRRWPRRHSRGAGWRGARGKRRGQQGGQHYRLRSAPLRPRGPIAPPPRPPASYSGSGRSAGRGLADEAQPVATGTAARQRRRCGMTAMAPGAPCCRLGMRAA